MVISPQTVSKAPWTKVSGTDKDARSDTHNYAPWTQHSISILLGLKYSMRIRQPQVKQTDQVQPDAYWGMHHTQKCNWRKGKEEHM